MRSRISVPLIAIVAFLLARLALAVDDASKYTTIGNINLTLSNYGTYGDGFNTQFPDDQPSCEYPTGSHVEHMFDGGIWIGAKLPDGQIRVSTAAVDIAYLQDVAAGFEFTNSDDPADVVMERSTLLDSRHYHPEAISHQDFLADFTDSNRIVPGTSIVIPDHTPMNVSVHMETYAWNYPFADAFVIFNYTIKNTGRTSLNDLWVGLWADLVVRNVSITPPRIGAAFYQHVGNGWTDSLQLAYAYDYDGDPGFTDSYIGLKLLGVTPPFGDTLYDGFAHMQVWGFRDYTDPVYFSPQNDQERYQKMSIPLTSQEIENILRVPSNRMTLISTGPFERLDPDSTMNVVFTIVCGKKYGNDPTTEDTELAKLNLYTNAFWAQTAYYGEDRNGNGVLDPGEDLNGNGELDEGEDLDGDGQLDPAEDLDGDGILDRYILPTPPLTPRIRVVPEDKTVTVYWDARAEDSIDFISGLKDFEGYRVYRSRLGEDLRGHDLLGSMVRIAEYDSINGIGYDTGFDLARLAEPMVFYESDPQTGDMDTLVCPYALSNQNLHSGWQYAYSVTAYDTGDPTYGLASLESSYLGNAVRVFPGAIPAADDGPSVTVYPNPYVVGALWDGGLERERKLYFRHLPPRCQIRIYTLAGDLVDNFKHVAESYDGSDTPWFDEYSRSGAQFSGGEHAWDLITRNDQAVATGLYLYAVENLENGDVQRGRFLVIK